MFAAMAPLKFPMPMCIAMPIPRLYCPARLFPSLKEDNQDHISGTERAYLPCHDTREAGITTSDHEKSSKVFDSVRGVGNVNREPNKTKGKAGKDEGRAHFHLIGKISKCVENDCW